MLGGGACSLGYGSAAQMKGLEQGAGGRGWRGAGYGCGVFLQREDRRPEGLS